MKAIIILIMWICWLVACIVLTVVTFGFAMAIIEEFYNFGNKLIEKL